MASIVQRFINKSLFIIGNNKLSYTEAPYFSVARHLFKLGLPLGICDFRSIHYANVK